jgi:hypothetical protein
LSDPGRQKSLKADHRRRSPLHQKRCHASSNSVWPFRYPIRKALSYRSPCIHAPLEARPCFSDTAGSFWSTASLGTFQTAPFRRLRYAWASSGPLPTPVNPFFPRMITPKILPTGFPIPKIDNTAPDFLTQDEYNRLICQFSSRATDLRGDRDLVSCRWTPWPWGRPPRLVHKPTISLKVAFLNTQVKPARMDSYFDVRPLAPRFDIPGPRGSL